MASVELDRVHMRFGDRPVVRDVSLSVPDGELLVLVGPSGCGKSTILRLIAGLETPAAGRIRIGGTDVTDVAPQTRDIAMVFQHYALYPHMTVRENISFGLRMRRVPPAAIATRVGGAAHSLGLGAMLDRKPAQLSGGERQRVAFARAIVRQPKAFLLDEPLSNLDPRLRASTRAELAVLHRELGATMIYVTHDQEEAMTLGARIAVMRDGAIVQVAPPLDVYRAPATRFVAEFVGVPEMNALSGQWRPGAGGGVLVAGAVQIPVPAGPAGAPRDVIVGIRPHDVTLALPHEADATGRVDVVEALGSANVIHVEVDGLPGPRLRVLLAGDLPVALASRVGLRLRRDRLHVFDAATGERLPEAWC